MTSKYANDQALSGILRDIKAVKEQNDRRIQLINTKTTVNTFQYVITQSTVQNCFKFDIIERQMKENATAVVKAWRSAAQLIVIPDIFNDKLNYSCQTYDDLTRLNGEMYIVAQKYELFGDSEKARQEASKFLKNFHMITTNLKQIEEDLEHETSKLEELRNKVNDINGQFEQLMRENKNLSIGIDAPLPKGQLSCSQCGQHWKTMNYYRNNVEPARNNPFRVNGYSALCVEHDVKIPTDWIFVGTG